LKAKRLEEVLDECLGAYLEGRRSIEESLSLYPSLRSELEPLLRTAAALAVRLQTPSPAEHLITQGRERFLESAEIRRRARELTRDIPFTRRLASGWRFAPWGLVAGAVVAIFAVAAFSASALDSGSPEPGPQAQLIVDDSPPAVADLRQAQEEVRVQAAEGGSVSPQMILDLVETTTDLEAQVKDFDILGAASQHELERALGYQYLLLRLVIDTQPGEVTPEARRALVLTRELAREWGVELPELTPHASATASPTPSALPGGTPSSTPSTPSTPSAPPPSPSSSPPSPTPPLLPEIPGN
jgi:hypothetical protein